jgi:hypothetical protein
VSKLAIVEIWKQIVGIKVTQLFNAVIPTIKVETVVAPNINFVRNGILVGSATNLGHGLGGVSAKRNLSKSSRILISTIRIIGTP